VRRPKNASCSLPCTESQTGSQQPTQELESRDGRTIRAGLSLVACDWQRRSCSISGAFRAFGVVK
jgi:hypothetical protein